MKTLKNKKLTNAARDQDCTIQLSDICNGNRETVVAAHINMRGHGCMGGKTHDLHVVFACSACHDEIDGRTRKLDRSSVRLEALEALLRTQDKLIEMGVIK